MKRVVFINTPLQDYSKVKKEQYSVASPLGLGYLATIVKDLGYDVVLLDAEIKGLTPEQIISFVKKNKFDTACINLLSPTLEVSKQVIKGLKHLNIIVGGSHATICPEQVLKEIKGINILVRGEGELAIKEIFQNKTLDSIKGISYLKNRKIIHNKDRPYIKNLDGLPIIDRSFLKEKDEATIMTSRGCPHRCIFCTEPLVAGNKIRARSIKNVVDEIEKLKTKNIHFIDDNFIHNKKRLLSFVKELEKRKLKIKWRCLARTDVIAKFDKKIMKKIKDSGCYRITFGFESGCRRILKLMKKDITIKQIRTSVKLCKSVGIKIKAYFMLGFPGETVEEMKKTIKFASGLDTDINCFVPVKAYPGTELYKDLGCNIKLQEYINLNRVEPSMPMYKRWVLKRRGVNFNNFIKYNVCNKEQISSINVKDISNMLIDAYQECYGVEK